MPTFLLRTSCQSAIVALACSLLAACGGGGKSTATPDSTAAAASSPASAASSPASAAGTGSTSGGTSTVDPLTDTSLQTTVAAGVYTDPLRKAQFDALNALRSAAGVGMVSQSTKIDVASQAHAAYVAARNNNSSAETAGQSDFYGADPTARLTAAGYTATGGYELIGNGLSDSNGVSAVTCVTVLSNSAYHMAALFSPIRQVGVGYALVPNGGGVGACVLDMAYASGTTVQLPATGWVAKFPADGSTGVQTTFDPKNEAPQPLPSVSTTVGQPILASTAQGVSAGAALNVTAFSLVDGGGNPVPVHLLAGASTTAGAQVTLETDAHVQAGQVIMVPAQPLASTTKYTVTFASNMGTASWSFTTR